MNFFSKDLWLGLTASSIARLTLNTISKVFFLKVSDWDNKGVQRKQLLYLG